MIVYTPPKAAERIPVIDLAGVADPAARKSLAWEVHKAARQEGFFYIVNHGVAPELMAAQLETARRFFALPLEAKLAVHHNRSTNRRGYDPLAMQTLDAGSPPDLKESFVTGREVGPEHWFVREAVPFEGENLWPESLEGFREQVSAYTEAMTHLGRDLTALLAQSLDLAPDYFADGVDEPSCTVRLLHYPPHPADAAFNQLGSGAHTDWGLLTLLLQDDCGGLEVLNGDGEWIRADPLDGALIVNLGDMAQRLTGGLYHSNLHRVLNTASGADRYSVATFFNPHARYVFQTAPTCIKPGAPPEAPVSFGEHIQQMIDRTYGV